MFHLPSIRLWKWIALSVVFLAAVFAAAGTIGTDGPLVIHWSSGGEPNGFAGKWALWGVLLLAVLSMFAQGSLTKKRPGSIPVGPEMAGALTAGLAATFSFVDVTIVVYGWFPTNAVPVIGTAAIAAVWILFPLAAHVRGKAGSRRR